VTSSTITSHFSHLGSDIRYALRSFLRAPGFTLVALVTLALGIGGTTAIFSIVDGVVLRPLPYSDPDRVVDIVRTNARGEDAAFSGPDYRDLKKGASFFSAMAGYRSEITDLTGRAEPVRVRGLETTAAFFDIFDVPPILGRTYHEATDKPGAAIAVIGEAVWRQQFGSDPSIVGSVVRVNNKPTEIIGVVPERLRHPGAVDVWVLAAQDVPTSPLGEESSGSRDVNYFSAVARIAHDRSLTDAREQLRALAAPLTAANSPDDAAEVLDAKPLAASMVANVRTALLVVLGAVGFVLLIACANVAGLMVARGAARRREIAVRTALGAGRGQLIRQLLTESLVLAVAGGLAGMLVANWALDLLVGAAPENLPRLGDIALDWRVGVFAFAATLAVGVLFGLAPALSTSRPNVNVDLKDGGRTGTSRTGGRNAMVVAQVALALVLLIGAGLMLVSFARLRAVDPGFRTTDLVTIELMVPLSRYDEKAQIRFYSTVLERMRANPLTAQSALMFPFPFGGGNAQAGLQIVGEKPRPRDQRVTVELNSVSPGYLHTSGIRLLRGRDFAETDGPGSPLVALISESVVKEFGGKDPIGQQIDLGSAATVVGIVSDARRRSLDQPPRPAVFLPYTRFMLPYFGAMIRTENSAAVVTPVVKKIVAELDPDLPIGEVHTIEQIIEQSTGEPRFRSYLIAVFALLALLLAAVGVYGLISFTVAQRVPEIGVRLALGASPSQVFRQVIGQGVRLAVIGIVAGLGAAVAATALVRGLLFDTSATDPVIYASLSLLLLAIAALACYVPARRAMRVDPMTALRSE
jgi:putative ABC transport system permease protein